MRIRFTSVVLFLLGIVAVAAALTVGSVANAADKQPNIVFIFADNFGYGEVGSYGGVLAATRQQGHDGNWRSPVCPREKSLEKIVPITGTREKGRRQTGWRSGP